MKKMTNENDQFVEEAQPVKQEDVLNQISKLGIDYVVMRNQITQLKNQLELREKQFKHLSEVAIPEMLLAVNMRSFGLTNGFKLEVKPFVLVTLPKDKADEAEVWLDENGHSGMMKHHLDVYLPKGISAAELQELKNYVEALGYNCADTKSIHYQTLLKWGREMEDEGEVIPEEIFKVYRGYKTEIKE
jgi:hypothetical protein